MIYLDHNAITPVRPEARDALLLALERFGNPSSVHRAGRDARDVLDLARDRVAHALGARPGEVVFTSGATEGAALAIRGVLGVAPPERRRLVVTAVEHPCVLSLARALAAAGTPLTVVPVDRRGELDVAAFRAALGPDVALAAAMRANNETGVLLDVPALAAAARERAVPFLCDAVQAVGKIEVDVRTLGADLVLATSQKLGGPRGAGVLWIAPGLRLAPIFGGEQERGRRAGTENLPGVAGLGAAIEAAVARRPEEAARVGALRDRLEAGLLAAVPRARVNGAGAPAAARDLLRRLRGLRRGGAPHGARSRRAVRERGLRLPLRVDAAVGGAPRDGPLRRGGARHPPLLARLDLDGRRRGRRARARAATRGAGSARGERVTTHCF